MNIENPRLMYLNLTVRYNFLTFTQSSLLSLGYWFQIFCTTGKKKSIATFLTKNESFCFGKTFVKQEACLLNWKNSWYQNIIDFY